MLVGTAAKGWWCRTISSCWSSAVQPGAQSGRADLALSAQSLARQLGVCQPGGHHGRLRDGLEPVCQQPRPGPLALRGRLGSGFARSIAGAYYRAFVKANLCPEIFGDPYNPSRRKEYIVRGNQGL